MSFNLKMPEILVFSERDELAFELLRGGREFAEQLEMSLAVALLGEEVQPQSVERVTDDYLSHGADVVYLGQSPVLKEFQVDLYAAALHQIMREYGPETLLLGSTKRGKELAGRVAQKLDAGCVTDAIDLSIKEGNLLVDRYALGGNTVSSELIKTELKVISVIPKTFERGEEVQPTVKPQSEAGQGEVIKVDLALEEPQVKIVERREKKGEAVNIEEAERLVCIGRGLEKEEDLALIRELATALGGEIGCTRTLSSDYRWLSEERLVGISGKKCKPRLNMSIGISGQIQYVVGVLGAHTIVAINKDKGAPIFSVADYGIIGDLYQVVPKLIEKLKAL